MGQTSEKARKDGTVEVVVLHGVVAYRDPDDSATDPREYSYRQAFRGQRIEVTKAEAERFFSLGSATKPDSEDADFAEAGMRDPSVLAAPPSAAMVAPESSQVGAIKAVVQDRVGDPAALMKLDEHQLKQVAVAFGIPVKEGMSHAELAQAIVGSTPDDSARGITQQSDLPPDQAQVSEKDRRAATRSSGGSSRSSGSHDDGPKATESAQKLAAENDVDLSEVEGTGADGQVTQPDVAKYIADRDAS